MWFTSGFLSGIYPSGGGGNEGLGIEGGARKSMHRALHLGVWRHDLRKTLILDP